MRRLQADPSLPGIGAVLLDEFHERSVDADLCLTLCRQVQEHLRPELRLMVMSATLGGSLAARCAELLAPAGACPVLTSSGRQFPVEILHVGEPGQGRGDAEQKLARTVRDALEAGPGDVLCFLPGEAEIRRACTAVGAMLAELPGGGEVEVLPLFGALPPAEQDRVLAGASAGRRVVIASAIAESSLTIPGVRAVVDSGLSRSTAFDAGSSLSRLVTGRTSQASAEQRAGRAGRLGPGRCYRLYSALAHAQRPPQAPPEIAGQCDLSSLALSLAAWGAADLATLRWLDAPPAGGMAASTSLLQKLGALDGALAFIQRFSHWYGMGVQSCVCLPTQATASRLTALPWRRCRSLPGWRTRCW